MLTFNQVQTILVYLSDKLLSVDNNLVQKYIKDNYPHSLKFYYGDNRSNELYYIYKHDRHINLHSLTQEIFDSLSVISFLEIILVDAENLINAARDEQIKPYLTRIDNL